MRKFALCSFAVFILLFTCLFTSLNVQANKETEEQQAKELGSSLSLTVVDKRLENYEDSFIFSFDVSDDDKCVILLDDATIVILNPSGSVNQILKFNKDIIDTKVRRACIKWKDDDLELMLGYGVSYLFTETGELLDVCEFTSEQIRISNPSGMSTDKYVYEMKNDFILIDFLGGGNYSKLIRIDQSGKEKLLYDSKASLPGAAVFVIVFVIAFHAIGAYVALSIVHTRKQRSKRLQKNTAMSK